jgi:pyruvate dehydrogenase E2 component (dihydrolipoamide acetyltransferase)
MFRFVLPDIGEGVVEAEVQQWFVKPGDHVLEDQPLVEVMTDKATVTIPSPRRGTITKLLCQPGQKAKVHEPLLEMVEDVHPDRMPPAEIGPGERMPAPEPEPGSEALEAHAAGAAEGGGSPAPSRGAKALATPAIRAMARQLGVDLGGVVGTGKGGRVTREDLEQVRGGKNGKAAAPEPPPAPQRPAPFEAALPSAAPATPPPGEDEVLPLRGIRRRIAERMAQSKRTAVHFTFVEQCDVTELVRMKNKIAGAARVDGAHVTFLPFIVKATVSALKKHPWLNATIDEARNEIRLRRQYHIGVATATPQGLLVPVVRDADKLSLLELSRELERLAASTRAGRARPEELTGSTFTLTSLGAHGGLLATPVINFPEVAILGIHRIRPTPVVREGEIVARDVMNISLSCDHRIVDGHVAAEFAYTLIGYLEDPNLLFMEMH